MATAAKILDPQYRVSLPRGEGDNKRAFVNEAARATVQLVEMVPSDEGGETAVATDLGQTPLGTREIYTQYRKCGDYYCFIHGKRQVSAVGDSLAEAFRNALALAEKSA